MLLEAEVNNCSIHAGFTGDSEIGGNELKTPKTSKFHKITNY